MRNIPILFSLPLIVYSACGTKPAHIDSNDYCAFLYDKECDGDRYRVMEGGVPRLTGFEDKTTSIYHKKGCSLWLYKDANFCGPSSILWAMDTNGYTVYNASLNNAISSAYCTCNEHETQDPRKMCKDNLGGIEIDSSQKTKSRIFMEFPTGRVVVELNDVDCPETTARLVGILKRNRTRGPWLVKTSGGSKTAHYRFLINDSLPFGEDDKRKDLDPKTKWGLILHNTTADGKRYIWLVDKSHKLLPRDKVIGRVVAGEEILEKGGAVVLKHYGVLTDARVIVPSAQAQVAPISEATSSDAALSSVALLLVIAVVATIAYTVVKGRKRSNENSLDGGRARELVMLKDHDTAVYA